MTAMTDEPGLRLDELLGNVRSGIKMAIGLAKSEKNPAEWRVRYLSGLRDEIDAFRALTPAASDGSHRHDGYAYDGCSCVCCTNVRARTAPPTRRDNATLPARSTTGDDIRRVFIANGWAINMDDRPGQPRDPFEVAARLLAAAPDDRDREVERIDAYRLSSAIHKVIGCDNLPKMGCEKAGRLIADAYDAWPASLGRD